jgi:hypothetical protein
MQPTVVDNVTEHIRLYAEESFGPVVAVLRVGSTEEAVKIANDSGYGLSAAIFGRDIARALTVAQRIDSGICHINGSTVHDEAQMPFGGVKASGYGRFGEKRRSMSSQNCAGSRSKQPRGTIPFKSGKYECLNTTRDGKTVRAEIEDGIGWAIFSRPEKRNAMSPTLNLEMRDLLETLELDEDVRVLVLTGAGESWSAGMDLKEYFREIDCARSEFRSSRRLSEHLEHWHEWHSLHPKVVASSRSPRFNDLNFGFPTGCSLNTRAKKCCVRQASRCVRACWRALSMKHRASPVRSDIR